MARLIPFVVEEEVISGIPLKLALGAVHAAKERTAPGESFMVNFFR